MRLRPRRIAAWVLLAVVLPWATPGASAGMATYEWGCLSGGGYDITYPGNLDIPFTASGGSLLIGYDPDSLSTSFIEVWIGGPGFQVTAYEDFQVQVFSGSIAFSAVGLGGQSATVIFAGDPGPLIAQGLPESLDPLLDATASVNARGAYDASDQFVFGGQASPLPEPSAPLSLLVGMGGVSLACRAWGRRGPTTGRPESRGR